MVYSTFVAILSLLYIAYSNGYDIILITATKENKRWLRMMKSKNRLRFI